MLAKEIIEEVLRVAQEKNLSRIERVRVEIGQIAMAHDGHDEHVEDISIENLQFGIASIAKGTLLEKTRFDIKKVNGESWSLVDIDGN